MSQNARRNDKSQQHGQGNAPRKEREWMFTHLPTRGALAQLRTRRLRLRVAREVVPIKLYNQQSGALEQSKAALHQLEVHAWDSDRITRKDALLRYGTVLPATVINAIVKGKLAVYEVPWFHRDEAPYSEAHSMQVNLGHMMDVMTGNPLENKSKSDRRYLHAVTVTKQIPRDPRDPSKGTIEANVVTHVIVASFDKNDPKKKEDGDRVMILVPTLDDKKRPFAEILRIFVRYGVVQKNTSRLAEDHDDFEKALNAASVESLLEVSLREVGDDEEEDRDRRRSRREERPDEEDATKTAGPAREKNTNPKYGWCVNAKAEGDQPCKLYHGVRYQAERQCGCCKGEMRVSKSADFLEQMYELEQRCIAAGGKPDPWAQKRLEGFTPKAPAKPVEAPAPA